MLLANQIGYAVSRDTMTTVVDLPNEVLDLIFARLDQRSTASYRLCCKAMSEHANPKDMTIKARHAKELVHSDLVAHARGGLEKLRIVWDDLPIFPGMTVYLSETRAKDRAKDNERCIDLVQLFTQHRSVFCNVKTLILDFLPWSDRPQDYMCHLISLLGVLYAVMPGLTHLTATDCTYIGSLEGVLLLNMLDGLQYLELRSTADEMKRPQLHIPDEWDTRHHMQLSISNYSIRADRPNVLYVDKLTLVDCTIESLDFHGTVPVFMPIFDAGDIDIRRVFSDDELYGKYPRLQYSKRMEALHLEQAWDFTCFVADHPAIVEGVRTMALKHDGHFGGMDFHKVFLDDLLKHAGPTLKELTLEGGHYLSYKDASCMRCLHQLVRLTWCMPLATACRDQYAFLEESLAGMVRLQELEIVVVSGIFADMDLTQDLIDPEDIPLDEDSDDEMPNLQDVDFRSNILRICWSLKERSQQLQHVTLRAESAFDVTGHDVTITRQTLHDGPV